MLTWKSRCQSRGRWYLRSRRCGRAPQGSFAFCTVSTTHLEEYKGALNGDVCTQEFKADKQSKELQKKQSAETSQLQKLKGTLDALKARADAQ